MREQYDVVVIGGGTAGVVAAVQAARAGAATLLVEKNGMLGGTMTVAGVCQPALFHAWGRQVIAGIGWELTLRAVEEAGEKLPDFVKPGPRQNSHTIYTSFPLFAAIADETVRAAGADLLLHTMLAGAKRGPQEWGISLCTRTGLLGVKGKVLIDCTGDADAVRIAGFPVLAHETLQPGTLYVRVSGYDPDRLDYEAIESDFQREVAAGRMLDSDFGWGRPRVNAFLRGRGGNANHVCPIDGSTSESRTEAEISARQVVRRIYRFLRAQKGLEGLRIDWIAPEVGIRESVTIRGKKTITLDDYLCGRIWEDAVCYSFYPIDLHTVEGVEFRPLPEGVVPTIPRGAMLPEGSRFLLAPGRHMSGDRLANSAYRVQATCMASGQAAGAMAALSARTGRDPEELPMTDIRDLLLKHGAIVPPCSRRGERTLAQQAGPSRDRTNRARTGAARLSSLGGTEKKLRPIPRRRVR